MYKLNYEFERKIQNWQDLNQLTMNNKTYVMKKLWFYHLKSDIYNVDWDRLIYYWLFLAFDIFHCQLVHKSLLISPVYMFVFSYYYQSLYLNVLAFKSFRKMHFEK